MVLARARDPTKCPIQGPDAQPSNGISVGNPGSGRRCHLTTLTKTSVMTSYANTLARAPSTVIRLIPWHKPWMRDQYRRRLGRLTYSLGQEAVHGDGSLQHIMESPSLALA